jgi:glycogen operon protein
LRPPIKTSPGIPLPLGNFRTRQGFNFALFSRHAEAVTLLFFASGKAAVVFEIPLDAAVNRTGDIWHILVHDLDPDLRYGYRLKGPWDPEGFGHRYSGDLLLDPYARALTGGANWGETYVRQGSEDPASVFGRRCCLASEEFDWEGDRPLNIPLQDSIIYEMHVRGFTRHASSGVAHPGSYHGLIEKIPYLQHLGITAVELLPVTEFNENELLNRHPLTGERLKNFWGYSPISFFAPKAAYAINGRNGNQVTEFKEMVKALHRAGIEVILDIVFNHTAEGGSDGPSYSFRGLDNIIYYLLDPRSRAYLNFSGCGNTLNCNHPLVRKLIVDCLRYWVIEMHVDGFRFDLASILGRDTTGKVMENPPMVEKIAEDPILADTKIIAEAWDAAGLYQVGSFSRHPRWAEWNGRYRDDVRAFILGKGGSVAALATRVTGSADLYQHSEKAPFNSINFITSHDGFTLHDLVSYDRKHNEMNGEGNRDGCDYNLSWNGGVEGATSDPEILKLRWRRIRSLAVILFLSQGAPMFVAGDEFGRSQRGNNNAYCQDNDISWVDWRLAARNRDLLRFFRLLIALRKKHQIFRRVDFFRQGDGLGPHEIRWQSRRVAETDWTDDARILGFLLDGLLVSDPRDDDFFVILNSQREKVVVEIPVLPAGRHWRLLVDSSAEPPADFYAEEEAPVFAGQTFALPPLAALVLISKPFRSGAEQPSLGGQNRGGHGPEAL